MDYHRDSWHRTALGIRRLLPKSAFHAHSSFSPHTNYFLLVDICNTGRIDPERERHMTPDLYIVCRRLSMRRKEKSNECNKQHIYWTSTTKATLTISIMFVNTFAYIAAVVF